MNESKTLQLHDKAQGAQIELIVTRFNETENHVEDDAGYSEGRVVYTLIGPGVQKSSHDEYNLQENTALTRNMRDFLYHASFDELAHGQTITFGE